jgi:hypothetical protein
MHLMSRSIRSVRCFVALGAMLAPSAGCGTGTGSTDAGGDANPMSCSPDRLHTGLATPANIDAYDCELLRYTQQFNEPDALIFKAIIYVESRFQFDSMSCPNAPCGTPSGWSTAETQCFGLMQIVPACSGPLVGPGLLPNGHPNMTLDQGSASWSSSVFNPAINIQIGIAGIADNRRQVMQQFPGCSQDQYTLMAIGNYNSYGSTHGCDQYNVAYDNAVLAAYRQYATASGWPAHPY